MSIRAELEAREVQWLHPLAQKSASTQGRERPIVEDDLRTNFQRDRDRILHSKSFRRLKHKTQCFISPEGDHARTRLTHTLEVSQVARSIARAMRLNEDLCEAIALGHDLGHTPFGHMGERTLDRLHGFSHNEQSLRVVDYLENGGLNLTWEVRDGIAHHSGPQRPATLEGEIVHLSDRIAYINHDIDDALLAGIITVDELPKEALKVLGITHGKRIDTMVRDVIACGPESGIRMTPEVSQATEALRDFLFAHVYLTPATQREEEKADRMIAWLYEYYLTHPGDMTPPVDLNDLPRAACDTIAGMTDRYAVQTFMRLFIPR